MGLSTDYFNLATLTDAINILPNMYGTVTNANIFPDKGINTTSVVIEEHEGTIKVLPAKPRGAPATELKSPKRRARTFVVPHIPAEDVLLPSDYQNLRSFGSDNELEAQSRVINDRLQNLRNSIDVTKEYMRLGALKGLIKDGDGDTVADLFTEFGITKKQVNFELTTSTTDVAAKCREVIRHIEENLKGEVMTNVHCYVDKDFFDALVSHESVEKFFVNWQAAAEIARQDPRKGFVFQGITFEEYHGTVTLNDGSSEPVIESGYGHAFPAGTMNTFATYNAPADFNETVNTLGLPYYAKIEERNMGRGYDLHAQANPLPICKRPAVLVELVAA